MDSQPTPDPARTPSIKPTSFVLTLCAISALLIYLVYSQNILFGSKAGHWVYPYFDPITPVSRWVYPLVIGLLGLILFIGGKLISRFEIATLFGCFLIACLVEVLIHDVYPTPLWMLVDSDVSNSFYSVALHFSPIEILNGYNNPISLYPGHAGTNMPGKILIFHLLNLFTTSRQAIGYGIIVLSTLGAPLIYGICKRLFHDQRAAFYAFLLYVLVPGKLFFFPILNTVTPIFILLCLYVFIVYLDSKTRWLLLLLGAAFYLLVFFEPSPLVTGFLFLGILLHAIGEKKISFKDIYSLLALPAVAFLAVYGLMKVAFSFDIFHALGEMLAEASRFNAVNQRDYWVWLKENPKELIYAGAIPVMLIFVYLTAHTLSQWRSFKFNITTWAIEHVYLLSLLLTFVIVLFWGINRGEITRLWIYLAVFFQVPAAVFLAKLPKSTTLFFIVISILAVQSIITIQRVAFIMH